MSNILLTNRCNQKCPYCFAVDEMQKKKLAVLNEMTINNLIIILDFFKKNNERNVRLMGGEPTLHPKFKEIIDYIFSQGFSIQVFTNGIFSLNMAKFLAEKEKDIKYSFNINPPEMYSRRIWNRILKNLKILAPSKNCLIGSVIWQKDFNIDYLLDLSNKYLVRAIILRIANPVVGENNKYVSFCYGLILAFTSSIGSIRTWNYGIILWQRGISCSPLQC